MVDVSQLVLERLQLVLQPLPLLLVLNRREAPFNLLHLADHFLLFRKLDFFVLRLKQSGFSLLFEFFF